MPVAVKSATKAAGPLQRVWDVDLDNQWSMTFNKSANSYFSEITSCTAVFCWIYAWLLNNQQPKLLINNFYKLSNTTDLRQHNLKFITSFFMFLLDKVGKY